MGSNNKNSIPLVDLKAQYQSIKAEVDEAVAGVINGTAFIGGAVVKEFEDGFARMLGVRHCVGVGNGTDAIYVALFSLGVGPGDEVITAANSFIASSEAVTRTGARVVFADVDPKTYEISPAEIEKKLSPRTKALLPVHLYGHPADMEPILDLGRRKGIPVVEDTAQSHLAAYHGKTTGTMGAAGCFSFYPGKNLGAYGDAGAIVTNDDDLARRARMFSNHGGISKYEHEIEGINSRLDGLQAAILTRKLKHLPAWTEARRRIAARYNKLLDGLLTTPVEVKGCRHVHHLYVVRTPRREKLMAHLAEGGVSTGIHYPVALPNLMAYRHLGHKPSDFPVASRYQAEILSLPMYPELGDAQVDYIAERIKNCKDL